MSICQGKCPGTSRAGAQALMPRGQVRSQRAQGPHALVSAGGRRAGLRALRLRRRHARRGRLRRGLHQGRRLRALRQQGEPAARPGGGAPRGAGRRAAGAVRPRAGHLGAPARRQRALDGEPAAGARALSPVRRAVGASPARRAVAAAPRRGDGNSCARRSRASLPPAPPTPAWSCPRGPTSSSPT